MKRERDEDQTSQGGKPKFAATEEVINVDDSESADTEEVINVDLTNDDETQPVVEEVNTYKIISYFLPSITKSGSTVIKPTSISITENDIVSLTTPKTCISSNVLNFYVLMLRERENQIADKNKNAVKNLFFSTSFFSERNTPIARRRRLQVIRDSDPKIQRWFIPIYLDAHYTLLVVDLEGRKLLY